MRASPAVGSIHLLAFAAVLSFFCGSIAPTIADASDGTWRPFPLIPLAGRAVACDGPRHRLLMFGGSDNSYGSATHDEVWAFDLSRPKIGWSLLATDGTRPPGRQNAAVFYDPVGDRLLVFGGEGETHSILHDVWQLPLGTTPTWSEILPSGPAPLAALMRSVAFDATTGRMVVFGGYYTTTTNATWILALRGEARWSKLGDMLERPRPRYQASAAFDPVRGRFVVAGGTTELGGWLGDAWALELDPPRNPQDPRRPRAPRVARPRDEAPRSSPGGRWIQIASGGPNELNPSAVVDPARDRLVVLAGLYGTEEWVLDFATGAWSPLPDAAIGFGAFSAPLAFDPIGDRALIVAYRPINEVWQLSFAPGAGWTQLGESDATPGYRFGAAVVLDAPRDRVVLFGGRGNCGGRIHRQSPVFSDVLELPLDGRWRALAAGNGPSARWATAAVFDPIRERMIVFGGRAGWDMGPAVNEVWSLSLAGAPAWHSLSPAGTPPAPRWGSAAAYDPARDRVIVFGGTDSVTHFNDAWSLTLGDPPVWSPLAVVGAPPPRAFATLTRDPLADRMVLFGGAEDQDGWPSLSDLWSLDLADMPAWSPLAAGGTPPRASAGHGAVYDAARDRLIFYGAFLGLERLYELSLRPAPAWRTIAPAGAAPELRALSGVVFDPARDRLVALAGRGRCEAHGDCGCWWRGLADSWQLEFEPPAQVGVPEPRVSAPRGSLALAPPRPNPAAVPTVSFVLGDGSPARLEVFDMRGRRMLVSEVGTLGAGSHDLRLTEAGSLRPGVYVMRLTQARHSVSARMVVTK